MPKVIDSKLKELVLDYEMVNEHKKITDYIIDSLKHNRTEDLSTKVLMTANRRRYLG